MENRSITLHYDMTITFCKKDYEAISKTVNICQRVWKENDFDKLFKHALSEYIRTEKSFFGFTPDFIENNYQQFKDWYENNKLLT